MGVSRLSAVLAAWLAIGCSSSSNGGTPAAECLVGAERCACTQGGSCDPGLVCLSKHCVKDPNGGTGGSPGVDGGANAGGGRSHGGGSGLGQQGSGGGASPDGGMVASGGAGAGGAPPGPATCSFPDDFAFPKKGYDPTGNSTASPSLGFTGGTLTDLDGQGCTLDTSGVVPVGDWGSYPCRDGYVCGGCLVFLVSESAPASHYGHWAFLGASAATNGQTKGCDAYSATYDVCVRDCSTKQCGDSDGCGGICGCPGQGQCCNAQHQCVTDTCSQCLSDCSDPSFPNPSNCCTSGAGCVCAGACPGPCVP
ncbi:MAG TPA: hypothetical protein VHE30_15125 [Polyangiaceae bacterium]|nr:hypothetical protein [Polyangiaceae bacterium]